MDVRSDRLVREIHHVREALAASAGREPVGHSKDPHERKLEGHLRDVQLGSWTVNDAETYLGGSWSEDPKALRKALPRLLELFALEPHGSQLLAATTRRLAKGKFWEWSAAEKDALVSFFSAYWQHLLVTRAPWEISNATISALALVLEDLSAELLAWREGGHEELRRLAGFVVEWCRHTRLAPKPGDALAQRAAANLDRLDEWLHAPQTRAALEKAFYAAQAPGEGEELSKAVEHLEQTARP